ncbi:hypothetical protein [Corallococcus sp. 4LFB]|uniref:hypothetical protein n=1 Tax=Corallococcus sp. 4LFB TaxID=3383249 RepID=UPI0039761921
MRLGDGRRELREHALIARLHQCRQLVLEGLRVALSQGPHRAPGPLAQQLSAHEGQQLGHASQEGPLQGLNEEHVPGTLRHPGRQPQQLEFNLRAPGP